MKKFLSILLAMCFTSIALAASTTWQPNMSWSGKFKPGVAGASVGNIVYLVTTTDSTNIDTAIKGKTFIGSDMIIGDPSSIKIANKEGGGLFLGQKEVPVPTLSGGSTYDFYTVIFNASTVQDATKYIVSGKATGTIPATETSAALSIDFVRYFEDSTWQTVGSVPEPTVLALLALGVAGLALRRRA